MKSLIKKMLLVALSSIGILAFSQTQQDKNNMKTDTVALKKLSEMLKKKQVSKEELQKKAKELGIPYSGKGANGSYFELQGFEPNGTPIYYTTHQTASEYSPNREMPLQQEIIPPSKEDVKSTPKATAKKQKSCKATCKAKRNKKK